MVKLRQIVIDGFKSYRDRTTIDVHPNFTCITGLNGSGKSNIADAISFCLGVESYRGLRAESMVELIYKKGRCGHKKASVTLVFDSVIVTRTVYDDGKTKYVLDGRVSDKKEVHKRLQTLQFDPCVSFSVAQGQITKLGILERNELLTLLSEAAGTSAYDVRRKSAVDDLEKRKEQLSSINRTITEIIEPALERYVQAKDALALRTQVEEELEEARKELNANTRLRAQYEYSKRMKEYASRKDETRSLQEELRAMERKISEIEAELESCAEQEAKSKEFEGRKIETEAKIQELQLTLNMEMKEIEAVEEKINQLYCCTPQALFDPKKCVCSEEYSAMLIKRSVLRTRTIQLTRLSELYARLKNDVENGTGINAHFTRLLDFIGALRQRAAAEREVTKRIDTEGLKKEQEQLRKKVPEMRKRLLVLSEKAKKYDSEEYKRLNEEQRTASREASSLSMNYPKIDGVRGLVCELFTLRDSRYATAFDALLGSRACNLVVDNEETATVLLNGGYFHCRVTILPSNKIVSRKLSPTVVSRLRSPSVSYAPDLIECDKNDETIRDFLFGSFFICESTEDAERIAFTEKIACVTIDGDTYDPRGTLTGGCSERSLKSIMNAHAKLKRVSAEVEEMRECSEAAAEVERIRSSLETSQTRIGEIEAAVGEATDMDPELEHAVYEAEKQELVSLADRCDLLLRSVRECFEAKDKMTHCASIQWDLERTIAQSLEEERRDLSTFEEAAFKRNSCVVSRSTALKLKATHDDLCASTETLTRLIAEKKSTLDVHEKKRYSVAGLARLSRTKRCASENTLKDMKREKISLEVKVETSMESLSRIRQLVSDSEKRMLELGVQSIKVKREPVSSTELLERIRVLEKRLELTCKGTEKFENEELVLSKRSELHTMYETLVEDKKKLAATIEKLDQLKVKKLDVYFNKVSEFFTPLVRRFAPSICAILTRIGSSILDGVSLNVTSGERKLSVNELSGGQKSVLTLALLLSTLRCSGSPFYVLDEVDAALDFSSAQNVSACLQQAFPESQFFIVSLREETFTCAGKLYTVRSKDGASVVV